MTAFTNLVKFDTEFATAFERRRERIQILSPESEELLDAQAAQGVVSGVTDAVLLTHRHDLVVHVQRVLAKQFKYEPNMCFKCLKWLNAGYLRAPHLYGDVQHEAWLSCMSHTHHSDSISIAHTHFL